MFDYNRQLEIIRRTEVEFTNVTQKYTELLSKLSKDTLINLNIIYANKKLEVMKEQTPKGISQEELEMQKNTEYAKYKNIMENYIYQNYGINITVGSIEYNNFISHLTEIEKGNQNSATNMLENYKKELLQTYLSISPTVDIALPTHGISEIQATKHRENQYLNEIIDGIYATSGKGILDYIVRTNTGSMRGDGYKLDLPVNPFNSISNDNYLLNEPASVYHLDARLFEPVIDYRLDENGNVKLKFAQEWISRNEKLKCNEEIAEYVPKEYIQHKNITIQGMPLDEMLSDYQQLEMNFEEIADRYRTIGNNTILQENIDFKMVKEHYNPDNEMFPLKTRLNEQQSIELVSSFFKTINPEFEKYFSNDIINNRDKIIFTNNPGAKVSFDGKRHNLELTNFGDLRDVYSAVHEYTHLLDSVNGVNYTRRLFTETNAQCMERILDNYLLSLSDDKLIELGIDKNVMKTDIVDRRVATFFTRLKNINEINPNQKTNYIDVGYMLSQIYSTEFSKLTYDEQIDKINRMINATKENNSEKVLETLPCNLKKSNHNIDEVISTSIKTTIGEYKSTNRQKEFDQKSQIETTNVNLNESKHNTVQKEQSTQGIQSKPISVKKGPKVKSASFTKRNNDEKTKYESEIKQKNIAIKQQKEQQRSLENQK